jgi:diguanylate cyclase (GGDEF)-like protein
MSDSSTAAPFDVPNDFGKIRFDAFRSFAVRLGFILSFFPILTILPDGLERPHLWLHFVVSRAVWSALLLAYPIAVTCRVSRAMLPWILYASSTLLMIFVIWEQVQLGFRIPEMLLTICLIFVVIPMLGVPFSWKENALGIVVLLVALNGLMIKIPGLLTYIPRLELAALFLVFSMGFVHHQLERLLVDQFAYQRKIEDLAHMDSLTGICNRRFFLELGERILRQGARAKRPVSLILLDLDHFKAVNDRFGHAAGDAVIRGSVRRISRVVRETDLVARIGGEEFAILLPETCLETGLQVAERVRMGVEALEIPFEGLPHPLTITASLGLALAECGTDSLDSLMSKADHALYQAKGGGRNRVESYAPDPGEGIR